MICQVTAAATIYLTLMCLGPKRLPLEKHQQDTQWPEIVVVGSRPFFETIRMKLAHLVRGRKGRKTSAVRVLREGILTYNTEFPSQNSGLRLGNQYL
jgi:hypothetical protein